MLLRTILVPDDLCLVDKMPTDAPARKYPCDRGHCPFDADSARSGYFCRDNCGLGVEEEETNYDY